MASKSDYRVVFERDESGWWTARVPEVHGCHTQGRTVEEARRRIRDALGLFVDDANEAILTDDVRLPTAAKRAVRTYSMLRKRLAADERRASKAARAAVNTLQGGSLKLSVRDAASVLGVSHQRVHQLARATASDRRVSRKVRQ